MENTGKIKVISFYRFKRLQWLKLLKADMEDFMSRSHLRGSIILAEEGINGMVAGQLEKVDGFLDFLIKREILSGSEVKVNFYDEIPFRRARVKIKPEIVTLKGGEVDSEHMTGEALEPEAWNEVILKPETILIDCRNDYEYKIGTFENAINPETESFSEMVEYTEKQLADKKDKPIAMFCTGGIRCEKYSAYLREKGFKKVYQLEGGILRYLEKVKREASKWQGKCFVFDDRVAVDHGLKASPES